MSFLVSTKASKDYFNYSYGRYFSKGLLALAAIGVIIGAYLLFLHNNLNLNLIGFLLILIGISLFVPTEIFQINLETKEYRNLIKIFNFTSNPQWKDLSKVQYLSIINRKSALFLDEYKTKSNPNEIIEECCLRLFIKAGYTITVDEYKYKENAIYIGRIIALGLNLPLLDATTKPAKFIDL